MLKFIFDFEVYICKILCCAQSLNVGLGWVGSCSRFGDVGWVGLGQASSELGWVGSR